MNTYLELNNKLIRTASYSLCAFFLIFIIWCSAATLDSATISNGTVVVESNRKPIQHLEGGIISEVIVQEGEEVHKGQPLVKLSDVSFSNRLREVKLSYINEQLNYQSLKSQRDGLNSFNTTISPSIDPNLATEIKTLIDSNRARFLSDIELKKQEIEIINSRISSVDELIKSLQSRISEQSLARKLLTEEIAMYKRLLESGYTARVKVLELEREDLMLKSDIIGMQSDIESKLSSIKELKQQRLAIKERNRSNIESELSESRNEILRMESELRILQDGLERTTIRSPIDGVVLALKVNGKNEVVKPGANIMEIVPDMDSLIIESLVQPKDIDAIRKGSKAMVRFSAYNSRVTPIFNGEVIYVDADRVTSTQGDKVLSGYKIKVRINGDQDLAKEHIKLYPGMPAEIYVLLESKNPIEYFLEPLTDSFFRAFRES